MAAVATPNHFFHQHKHGVGEVSVKVAKQMTLLRYRYAMTIPNNAAHQFANDGLSDPLRPTQYNRDVLLIFWFLDKLR